VIRNLIFGSSLTWLSSIFCQEISNSLPGKGNRGSDLSKRSFWSVGTIQLWHLRYGWQRDQIEATKAIDGWSQQWLPCAHRPYEEDSMKHEASPSSQKSGTHSHRHPRWEALPVHTNQFPGSSFCSVVYSQPRTAFWHCACQISYIALLCFSSCC
jgi:hypothetical protein